MNDIFHILQKYFHGQVSEEERTRVERYREDNPEEYDLMEWSWKEAGKTAPRQFDLEKNWSRLENAIGEAESGRVVPLRRWISLAAALLVILSVGLWLWKGADRWETVATNGSVAALQLKDGTQIDLNKNSTLTFPKAFSGDQRLVKLQGEAFFEVARNEQQPFIIETGAARVTVLGTSFNVRETHEGVEVTVASGKVELAAKASGEDVLLQKGDRGILEGASLVATKNADRNFLSWKTGIFEFEGTPLPEVVSSLNTFYQDAFALYSSGRLPDCLVTYRFNKANISEVVETLSTICDTDIRLEDGKYRIGE